jgi:hypothetical protein
MGWKSHQACLLLTPRCSWMGRRKRVVVVAGRHLYTGSGPDCTTALGGVWGVTPLPGLLTCVEGSGQD